MPLVLVTLWILVPLQYTKCPEDDSEWRRRGEDERRGGEEVFMMRTELQSFYVYALLERPLYMIAATGMGMMFTSMVLPLPGIRMCLLAMVLCVATDTMFGSLLILYFIQSRYEKLTIYVSIAVSQLPFFIILVIDLFRRTRSPSGPVVQHTEAERSRPKLEIVEEDGGILSPDNTQQTDIPDRTTTFGDSESFFIHGVMTSRVDARGKRQTLVQADTLPRTTVAADLDVVVRLFMVWASWLVE